MKIKAAFVLGCLYAAAAGLPALAEGPFRLSREVDVAIVGVGGGIALSGVLFSPERAPLVADEIARLARADVGLLDRGATGNYSEMADAFSTGVELGLLAAPLTLGFSSDVRSDGWTTGVMYLETIALAAVVPQVVKMFVDRPRPFVYNPDAPMERKLEPDARRSFFSAHTTFAFSSAVFLGVIFGAYYPDSPLRPWVWGAGLTAAGVVGWLRIEAGMHFPTDVLAGAIVGSAIGWGIPALHRGSAESGPQATNAGRPAPRLVFVISLN